MNSFYPAATIILSEISITLLVLSGIMIFSILRNKRRNQAALSRLTDRLKQNESERLASLKTKLREVHKYPDEKVDEAAAGIIKAEMIFYQGLMETFTSGDGTSLEAFGQKIDSVIDAYRNLVPQAGSSPSTDNPSGDRETLKDEMAQLTAKNETLANELEAIKAAMEETNAEFTRAFTGRLNKNTKTVSPEEATADTPDDAGITADTPDDTAGTPEISGPQEETPDNTATTEAVVPEETIENTEEVAEPQQEPVETAADENNDDVDEVLKNIDLGDVNIDDNETDKQKDETPPSNNKSSDNAEKADDNLDESGIDQILDEAFEKSGQEKPQETEATPTAKEKTA